MNPKKIQSKELIHYILVKLGATSHVKLQKLLYFIQAWHLAILESPIIDDEFEAWVHGPVSRQIWDYLKDHSKLYRGLIIKEDAKERVFEKISTSLTKDQIELIDDVLNEYGDKTDYHLETLTHLDPPWIKARAGYGPNENCNVVIPKEEIKKFYKTKL